MAVVLVLVEQNLDFITELSGRVLLLQKGAIAAEVKGADATNPALIEEFTGFGGSSEVRDATSGRPTPPSDRAAFPEPTRSLSTSGDTASRAVPAHSRNHCPPHPVASPRTSNVNPPRSHRQRT